MKILTITLLVLIKVYACHSLLSAQLNSSLTQLILNTVLQNQHNDHNLLIAPKSIKNLIDFIEVQNVYLNKSSLYELAQQHQPPVVSLHKRWAFNFQKRDTHKKQFYFNSNEHIYTDMLQKDDMFSYARVDELQAQVMEMPLQGGEMKMMILLPYERDGLKALQHSISRNYSIMDDVKSNLRDRLLRFSMPIFAVESVFHMKDLAKKMKNSNFTNSRVISILEDFQFSLEAKLEFNEYGVGSKESVVVRFWNSYSSLRTTPIIFEMIHPFLFLIYDTEHIHFMGRLTEL